MGLQMSNWVTAAQTGDDRTVVLAAFTVISSRLAHGCSRLPLSEAHNGMEV